MTDDMDDLISEIEERLGYKITKMNLIDLSNLSDDCFSQYNDLIGHRIDKLIWMMRVNGVGTV